LRQIIEKGTGDLEPMRHSTSTVWERFPAANMVITGSFTSAYTRIFITRGKNPFVVFTKKRRNFPLTKVTPK
jgi:hypothetical protein